MLKTLSYFIATGFYSGLSPKAPGTMGTLCCAVLIWLFWDILAIDPYLISLLSPMILCGISTILGLICIPLYYESKLSIYKAKFDPQEVVIDEFAGFLLTLSFLPANITSIVSAFIAFRIFDILKPWPIKLFEKLPGAWGIMLDDLIAGIFAGVILYVITPYIQAI